jgi:putative ATP-binding cassette transporter
MPAGGVDDTTLREALTAVGLPELAPRLDESKHWALQLSPGEQQRIAFARALVQKPDWLFLDEATSAVDETTEARLYQLVRQRLVGTTVFSVGHRPTLRPFHARRLVLQPNGGGPASIVEVGVTSAPTSPGCVANFD